METAVIVALIVVLIFFAAKINSRFVFSAHQLAVAPLLVIFAGAGVSSFGKSGGWICEDYSRNYGDRCIDNGSALSKEECEIFCLTDDERTPYIDNIIKMTYDRGINFPVPKKFLLSILNNKQMQKNMTGFLKQCHSMLLCNLRDISMCIFSNMS